MQTLDPHLEGRVAKKTLDHYKNASARLVSRRQLRRAYPRAPGEWGDALMEYMYSMRHGLGEAEFIMTVSAVEFRFPRLMDRLACAHAAIREMGHRGARPPRSADADDLEAEQMDGSPDG